jgi:hypothetical protein
MRRGMRLCPSISKLELTRAPSSWNCRFVFNHSCTMFCCSFVVVWVLFAEWPWVRCFVELDLHVDPSLLEFDFNC